MANVSDPKWFRALATTMKWQFSLFKAFLFLTACAVCFAWFGVELVLTIAVFLVVGIGILVAATIVVQLLLPLRVGNDLINGRAVSTCRRETSSQAKSSLQDVDIVVAAADSDLSREPNSSIMFLSPPVDDSDVAALSEFAELKWLVLDNTDVSDAGLLFLSRFTKLRRLYLRGSRVTAGGVQRLQRILPDLEVLH